MASEGIEEGYTEEEIAVIMENGQRLIPRLPAAEFHFVVTLMTWIVEGPEVALEQRNFRDVQDAVLYFQSCLSLIIGFDRRLPVQANLMNWPVPPGGYRQVGNWSLRHGKGNSMGNWASPMTAKGRGKGGHLPVAEKGRGKGHPRGSLSRSRSRQGGR